MTSDKRSSSDLSASDQANRPAARELFRILDSFATGALLLDTEGTVLRANAQATMLLERGDAELAGLDFFRELLPPLEESGLGGRYRTSIRRQSALLEWEGSIHTPRGEARLWVGVRGLEYREGFWGIAVVEDHTALAEEEARRRRAERLAAVGELAAGVAHEVNNPLASIKSFAELLLRDASGTEQQRALEIIVQESTRIGRVVENLLNFARQQGVSGREPVNLSVVAAQVLELQKYALETAGIEVRQDLDHALSPVMGEAGALQQVVLNLVTNAEQALAGKTGERLLIVRTRESSEGVILSVVDNGPGIPRDVIPHIFDALGSADTGNVGMGLGVTATIIREHGGQVMAESEAGRGAAFFIRLPRAASAVTPAPKVEKTVEPVAQPSRPLRVLVADDEPTLRLAIALFLGRRGHHVTQAADAYEALQLAEEQEFDVALVDARMPGDGLALLEKLEEMPSLNGRTALMTGDLGRARTSQGITTGRPYLVKPFDMAEAVNLIEKLGR
jgi:two-component system NtrC family sensor kinase